MTTNHERASFGAALRDAAESFSVPPAEELHERAVRRGRRIKRRKAAGTVTSVGVVFAVAAVLTASLLSSSAPEQRPTEAKPDTPAGLGQYMAEHLDALLPQGAQLTTLAGTKFAPLNGGGYGITTPDGEWAAGASAMFNYGGHRYVFNLSVTRNLANANCASLPPTMYPCTSKPVGRGTLVSAIDGNNNWYYYWNLSDGTSVQLLTEDGPGRAPVSYTEQQIESLVAAPAWTSVLSGLPPLVHCTGLKMVDSNNAALGWVCPSTHKTYPGITYTYASNS